MITCSYVIQYLQTVEATIPHLCVYALAYMWVNDLLLQGLIINMAADTPQNDFRTKTIGSYCIGGLV